MQSALGFAYLRGLPRVLRVLRVCEWRAVAVFAAVFAHRGGCITTNPAGPTAASRQAPAISSRKSETHTTMVWPRPACRG